MRTITLAILTAALIATSVAPSANAAQRHHARKPAEAGEQFRNANNAVAAPAQEQRSFYSGGYSAPAGR